VQDKLLGLAHVYEIDREAGFDLTRQLGKSSSCFNGAVRVYWPGFTPSSYVRHPLYLPEQVAEFEEKGSLLEDYLFQKFANIAASRFSEGEVWKSLDKKINEEQREELNRLRQRLEEERERATEEEGFLEEMERLLNRNEQLLKEKESLKDKNKNLEKELAITKENLMASYQADEPATTSEVEDDTEISSPSLDSVASALQQASEDFEERITVWDSAEKAAEESEFGRPQEVYDAIQVIAELANQYFSGDDFSVGEPWEEFFERRNYDYAPSEHDNTMNMHGEHRIFKNDGERREMQRHITLGGGSRKHCIQIYFLPDKSRETFCVGYCGDHLPYYGQST